MGNGLGVFSPWIYGQGKGRKEGLNVSSTSPRHRISIYFSYILRPPLEGRALHSQECFLPPRGGFNLRCTHEPRRARRLCDPHLGGEPKGPSPFLWRLQAAAARSRILAGVITCRRSR